MPASLLGLAHVASCSFLASRLAPSGQFWAALGGGIALARAGALHGVRAGYGASLAAIVQTVALIGPARVSGPLTQALNAPLVGRMQARGASRAARLGAVLTIRLLHYAVLNAAFVLLVVGGLDAYVATYDRIAAFTRVLPRGTAAAVWLTVAAGLGFALFYSTIQTVVYERALRRWDDAAPGTVAGLAPDEPSTGRPAHGSTTAAATTSSAPPRARLPFLALACTAAAWAALLASTAWPVLAAVGTALAAGTLATRARRAGRDVWAIGLGLAAVLAVGAIGPAVIGAVPWEGALQRAVRAALLVLTATWARAVTGAPGLREAARRSLWQMRRVPAAAEAADITERLESDRRLLPAARAFVDAFHGVPTRPLPVADALTEWVAAEAGRYDPPPPAPSVHPSTASA